MSIAATVLREFAKTNAPMTIAEINSAMGGTKDYAANIYNLANTGKLERVGTHRPARFTLPRPSARAANDSKAPARFPGVLAPSLGAARPTPPDTKLTDQFESAGGGHAVERDAGHDSIAKAAPLAVTKPQTESPEPSRRGQLGQRIPGFMQFPADTALRLIALALSAPTQLERDDRDLISEAIHGIAEQMA